MEQIVQLRTMRDEALERLQANPDFKLVNSLDALIKDLEAVVVPVAVQAEANTSVVDVDSAKEDVVVEDFAAEIEAISSETPTPEVAEVHATAENSELSEELSGMADSLPDDTAAAIEALEAELSQSPSLVDTDNAIDDVSAKSNSTIN